MSDHRFQWPTRGKALPDNMVTGACCRFTVLTPSLIRMEYDPCGKFEDRACQRFFYRDFPAVAYTAEEKNGCLTVETDYLVLTYRGNEPFSERNLSITLRRPPCSTWVFGHEAEQLKGTTRTLDKSNGPVPLRDGVLSRNGYTVVDDSDSMLLSDDGWFDLRREGTQDLYFFGYGHRYEECIRDFYLLTGRPPLLPDYALGNWWSRYHKYTQTEYEALIERFEREQVPLSVAVVDMDWHIRDGIPEENFFPLDRTPRGWTGWTWNRDLFPDYRAFLRFLHCHGLRTALNLHPAQGIQTHEAMYPEFCAAIGQDPAEKKRIPLDVVDPDFMEKYFDILLHPYEKDGVDFWWLDWQQGAEYWWIHDETHPPKPLEKMNPEWLLNHLHILDISRSGKRPMFFSRYAGLGSHRYPVGFSGDTEISWRSLDFQPYFTANASNAGYCWWSHDIGGHHHGYRDDDLMVRWMQFGVFSPINRLHACDNPFAGKEPWNLQPRHCEIAKSYLRLRHRLFPYLYTMNYRCSRELIPLIRPMYYAYPEEEAAYRCPNEYLFGSEGFVAPITKKTDPVSFMGKTEVWFPEGIWTDAFTGNVYRGGRTMTVCRSLERVPVFCKAGAIVPLQDQLQLGRAEDMRVLIFPGADNTFTLIEDAGDGIDAPTASTMLRFRYGKESAFNVSAAEGDASLIPGRRNWTLMFRGFRKDCTFSSDAEITAEYDAKTHTHTVTVRNIPTAEGFAVRMTSEDDPVYDNADYMEDVFDLILHAQMANEDKQRLYERILAEGYREVNNTLGEPTQETLADALLELLELGGAGPGSVKKR